VRLQCLAAAALVTLVALAPSPAAAALYRWTDGDGTVHYTGELDAIPPSYRAGAQEVSHPLPGAPGPSTVAPTDAGGTVIPYTAGAPMVVDAVMNGVAVRLIVDTGADRTTISPAALERAGVVLAAGSPVRITGVTGTAAATVVSVPALEVAGLRLGPVFVIAHAVPMEGIDGLLGRDVLDAFTVTVEGGSGRATLMPR
jgi:hypothetical protein